MISTLPTTSNCSKELCSMVILNNKRCAATFYQMFIVKALPCENIYILLLLVEFTFLSA